MLIGKSVGNFAGGIMNGETTSVIKAIERSRDQQHKENLDKFEEIFKFIKDSPCKVHSVKLGWIFAGLGGIWTLFLIVVGILIKQWLKGL